MPVPSFHALTAKSILCLSNPVSYNLLRCLGFISNPNKIADENNFTKLYSDILSDSAISSGELTIKS
jgi:hypothetical protein